MDDLISRQVVLKDLKEYIVKPENAISVHPDDIRNYNSGLLTAIQVVTETPPAQPESKKGKWIKMSDADGSYYACSECGKDLPRVPDFNPQFDLFSRLKSLEKTNFCPNCGADLRKKDGQKPMKPTKKDYSQAIESALWYAGLWPIVQKWKYRPVDQGQITAPPAYGCPNPEANPQTYYQLQLIWMIAVELFGDCGTSPRSGWITDIVGFRRWITDLTYESALYASEKEGKTNEV